MQVRADAPYKTVNDLLAAIKANPGKFKASGTGQGGIWHLAHRRHAAGPEGRSGGRAVGAVATAPRPACRTWSPAASRSCPCSLPEARSLIDAGKVQEPGGHERQAPPALYPNVPTLKAATGSDWTIGAWRGIAAPKGMPSDVRDKLVAAIKKIAASKEYNDFMASRGFGVVYARPGRVRAASWPSRDADLGATMKAVGIAK